ncbi:peptidoglycan DD-metalloendopeptidase family protein [Dyadobacter sp. Leaf189]|uniref:peptidoglycan DD-metalloendopeptidase family protein n=1 Tax=Dyadobacter sp. Leaf189 TaxID=1736295 RepID=UPI0006F8CC2C|nr:peptidoglycan DD-metalloendopeptidase family protein [Dyadobacter sp. Leaf189]KQS32651.1 peptidase M23 [Dyadobacter sp. Leaf189]
MSDLKQILGNYPAFAKVIDNVKPYRRLDFSASNEVLLTRDLSKTSEFSKYVFEELLSRSRYNGIGGYGENRVIYRQRMHFGGDEPGARSIHLGTDIWIEAGEPLFAPLDGTVHSYAFNNHYGDYGPTIILAHELSGVPFYTLYGHLSLSSLDGLAVGKRIAKGERFASIGDYPENGDWPPHLHFQVISDIGDYEGDFPGVSSFFDQDYYFSICPDPNLILRIAKNS